MAIQAKRCTECNGLLELRLGSWECLNCGHNEPVSSGHKAKRRGRASKATAAGKEKGVSSAVSWKKEDGTHLLDFSKGSGRHPQRPGKPKPPPSQAEPQATPEYTERKPDKPKYYVQSRDTGEENREAEQRLTVEKNIYFGLWLLLSAYCCYSLVIIINQGLFDISFELHEVIYIAVFCVAVMIAVMWYTLYCESPEIKWIFVVMGSLTALGQMVFSFVVFTNESFIDNLTFDAGYSGIAGLVVAAGLTVGWTCWYVYILYRDAQRMQS